MTLCIRRCSKGETTWMPAPSRYYTAVEGMKLGETCGCVALYGGGAAMREG